VTFKVAPNFEAPADAGANSVYDITVTASDNALGSASLAVSIAVTDVEERVRRVGGSGADQLTVGSPRLVTTASRSGHAGRLAAAGP
jgi:hypothetical protein